MGHCTYYGIIYGIMVWLVCDPDGTRCVRHDQFIIAVIRKNAAERFGIPLPN